LVKITKTRVDTVKRKKNSVCKYLKNDIVDLLKNSLDYNAYGRGISFSFTPIYYMHMAASIASFLFVWSYRHVIHVLYRLNESRDLIGFPNVKAITFPSE